MSVFKLYFSPTGGTKKVADRIGDAWEEGVQSIDLFAWEQNREGTAFSPQDVCLIAVPAFGGRVPALALERLKTMQGNGARAVLIAVYGNRDFDDTLLELQNAAESCGFTCTAAVAAVAEHSIFRQFGAGRPDAQDNLQLSAFGKELKAWLEQDDCASTLSVPGKTPYREYHGVPLKPKADKSCTACGLCVKQCPVQAIPADALRTVNEKICISCMHCVAICPQKARKNAKMLIMVGAKKIGQACAERKENQLFL